MGIDLATWRARIGLNYYHKCRPLQTRWRSNGGRLYQPGVASWGVGEVMNDTPLLLKGCMTVVALSLILQYVVHCWSKLKGRGGGGKVRCHWQGCTSQVRGTVYGGGTLLLRAVVVVIPLLLVMAGDVEKNPGPPKSQEGTCTIETLLEELEDISGSEWFNLGIKLGVKDSTLRDIEANHRDVQRCKREMLRAWLQSGPTNPWTKLATTLKCMGRKVLAQKILEKYTTPHYPIVHDQATASSSEERSKRQSRVSSVSKSSTTSEARQSDRTTSPTSSEGSQKPPFGCGCGKCTFFGFIESGCPTPISSASSFPYLDLSRLTHEQQQELKGRLRSESQEIMMRFQKLVSATIKSIQKQCVPLDELVSHVMTLGAFEPVFKESKVPLFQYCFKELEAADSIPKVFLVLKDYFSFFNYHIIEHIIEELGTEKDKERLQTYKEDFSQYAKRRIFECHSEFGAVSAAGHTDIFVKLDPKCENYTIAEIEVFRHKLSEILRVSSQGVLRLCRVVKGCSQLTFQVPSFVQQEIFPLSTEQEMLLETKCVTELTCGEYQFLDNKDFLEKHVQEIDTSADEAEDFPPVQKKLKVDTDAKPEGHKSLLGVDVVGEKQLVVTNEAMNFKWKNHGLKLHVPANALPEGVSKYLINIKASLSGQFELPEGYELVSAVYWVATPGKFTKSVTIETQHCANFSSPGQLHFVRTSCAQESLPYKFKFIDGGVFTVGSKYGALCTTRFSGVGIVKEVTSGEHSCQYCAQVYFTVKHLQDHWYYCHFVITKDLEMCLAVVNKKYQQEYDIAAPITFDADDVALDIPDDGIQTDSGWEIIPVQKAQIKKDRVDKFSSGNTWVPECVVLLRWLLEDKAPKPLIYKVNLLGTGDKNDFFRIVHHPEPWPSTPGSRLQMMQLAAEKSIVEGPKVELTIEDHLEVTNYLLDLGKTDIHNLGLTLGLHHRHLKTMGDSETFRDDMIDAWLQKEDKVLERGLPTWESLVKSLRDRRVNQTGVAEKIEKDKTLATTSSA